jgi:hypothetical protein
VVADASLVRKLRLKPGARAAVLGADSDYLDRLTPAPDGVDLVTALDGSFDWIQVFVRSRAELETQLPGLVAALRPESLLWISFPKGSSKIQTDLTRDRGWDAIRETDLMWITLVSLDATWSAFSLRPMRPGEARQAFR